MRHAEFIAMMALITSLAALSIDAVMPALPMIGHELATAEENRRQLVIGSFLLGMALAQVLFGPLSDSLGRKPILLFGIALFGVGCLISIGAPTFEVMILGRVIQGIGAAAPRVMTVAVIRDRFEGRQMAKTISMIMTVSILVPVLAPSIGQGVLAVVGWRGIFWLTVAMACAMIAWAGFRLPETLSDEHRHPLSFRRVGRALVEVLTHRTVVAYLMATACLFSAFVGYLTAAQQIFQETYGLGRLFPLAFGGLAGSIGLAAFVNSRIVVLLGMRRLVYLALAGIITLTWSFAGFALLFDGVPPLPLVFLLLVPMFFCHGMLFGNLNALAMQPMGHIAGSAAAVIGTVVTAISATVGSLIGQAYDGTVLPLAFGFAGFSLLALVFCRWADR
ncbi:MAG: multidrug effflux MFS transporter [Rhodospirillales bacterium]|jgi:DHA1 family bicyclomycin/chloramphenicol resistance-like MFS transporter|nr:multidrug effflux MFS transporter [Rhodospirillales bacterium]